MNSERKRAFVARRMQAGLCTWCGTVWEADTTEKGVYNYNMLGRSFPRMKCPLCAEKYVVGDFISCTDKEKENG